jgi:hypothetical protein
MTLDIGQAFQEGLSRLSGRPGLRLAAAFVVVALASAVVSQTLQVAGFEAMLETFRSASPDQLGVSRAEYDRQLAALDDQVQITRENSPLALEVPLSVAAAGMLVVAVVAEAVSVAAVRAFAAPDGDAVDFEAVVDGLGMATLRGFVGGVVVWGLIIAGSVFLLVPGLFAAVAFYFFRQEVALEDRTVIDAMAASWRLTRGERLNVFALGLLVVVVSQFDVVVSLLVGEVSVLAGTIVAAVLAGVLAAFGAAVVTRAYLQLTGTEAADEPGEPADPYDAALGPDDIPE